MYLTAGCNLACRHCWITPTYQPGGGSGGHLSLQLLERAILEAKPLGLRSCKLTGGEPSLHPEFHELGALLHRHGISYWAESNGVLIGAAEATMLRRTGLSFISVSLDGASAATHDYQRAVPGAYDAALRGIACLVAEGYQPQIIFTLTKDNAHELFDVFPLAARLGCGSVKVNLLEPTGRGQVMTAANRGFSARELIDIGHRVEEVEGDLPIKVHYSWPPAFWSIKRLLRGDPETCGVHGILGILADGTLAMCGVGRHVEELAYGRIGECDLADVWLNHPKLRDLRAVKPTDIEGVCGQCLHAARCFGACRASVYNAERSLRAPFKLCQDAFEAGLFPATRLRS